MKTPMPVPRRSLLKTGAATAAATLAGCTSAPQGPWRFFTEPEARTLDALCDQIIPPDETLGASGAGVVNYIDSQLTGHFSKFQARYRTGLAELDRAGFTSLAFDTRTKFLEALQGSQKQFFDLVVTHTMQGYYGDPRHGGNRGAVSWRMLGVPSIPIRGRDQYRFKKQSS